MRVLAACFRPFLCPTTNCHPPPNLARAYTNFGAAHRLVQEEEVSRTSKDRSKTWQYHSPSKVQSRCFAAPSVAYNLSKEENSDWVTCGTGDQWPRLVKTKTTVKSCRDFHAEYYTIQSGQTDSEEVEVRGRIWGFRTAGNKLAFVDLMQDHIRLQMVCNYKYLEANGVGPGQFEQFIDNLKRGDIVSVVGRPHRTKRNELSILISELPLYLSSCIRPLPSLIKNEESRMRSRHLDLLIRPRAAQVLKLGSDIKKFLREFLEDEGHISVKTPILADAAGGAVAKPFYTKGFEARNIALRIAPELWLKRLIVGGFERIYEIGPSFRNEGIDLTHNPEFETCEFYRTYADLEELIQLTERMFSRMSTELNVLEHVEFSPGYPRLDFIPAIEAEMGCKLPSLSSLDLDPGLILIEVMRERSIAIPIQPTLPRLLDKLSSHYLEPQCQKPTWIINHPECLSPLSKSFAHESNRQMVSARAELFVHEQEIVNTYEEENSPIAQREKFIKQLEYNNAEDIDEKLDEGYLEALEYGMPPTGGWGCGIDRLTMLFGGTTRIADTLAFGTLKNVVALGSHQRTPLPSRAELLANSPEKTPNSSNSQNSDDGNSAERKIPT